MFKQKEFSLKTRKENIKNFETQTYDLLIIGGGITGAGVARDAASRGMSVALVEMNDFASGTSSRSSKLIHGGIRYLENLEFSLVYEALSERSLLFELAPHLVHPLRFMLPIYKNSRVGMFKMGLGMWLYDILSLFEAPELHERLNPEETLERFSALEPQGLCGSYVYSDAYMDDDRLVLETLRSANNWGAHCASYVKALSPEYHEGKVTAVHCEDLMNGHHFKIKAQHIVSTVGPWTDEVGQQMISNWSSIMRPSKGIHITLPRERWPLHSAVVMASDAEKRIIFAIPRHEMIIVGTTDTDFQGDYSKVHSTKEDVDYLLKIVNEYFPGMNLKESEITASYAGVRPLVHDGSSSESGTSREHLILNTPQNITFVAGGKYTTYRRMAEQAVESCLGYFSIEEQVQFAHSHTKEPLNPQVTQESFRKIQSLKEVRARELSAPLRAVSELIDRYGPEVDEMWESTKKNGGLQDLHLIEAKHAIQNGMCFHLRDFYLRRTHLFLAEKNHGLEHIEKLANFFQDFFDWSDAQKSEEIQSVHKHIHSELSWKNEGISS